MKKKTMRQPVQVKRAHSSSSSLTAFLFCFLVLSPSVPGGFLSAVAATTSSASYG